MTHTYATHNGGTIEVTRRGYTVDLHVKDPAGRTVATVEMSDDDADALTSDLTYVTNR